MTTLDYTIQKQKKQKREEPQPVRTKTALSMQATLEGALNARQPQPVAGGMRQAATADGFGRSI